MSAQGHIHAVADIEIQPANQNVNPKIGSGYATLEASERAVLRICCTASRPGKG